jgi:membrane fusion protein (multidrug efflux system)
MAFKSKYGKWILVLAILAVALALPKLLIFSKNSGSDPASSGQQRLLAVQVRVVQPKLLQNSIRTTGTLLANEEVELRSETTGKVTGIFFKEDSRVKKGDLLVKINNADLRAQLQKLEFQKELAEEREFRQRRQLETDLTSQEQYDIALNALNAVKADIEVVQAQIAKTEIHAPFDGQIGLKYISEGSYLSPSVRVANLLNIHPIKIEFSIPEKYATEVQAGDKISFTIQGSENTYEGEIYAIEPKIDPVTRTLLVRALSPNPQRTLYPGSFADVQLIIERIPDALLIPTEAVFPEMNGKKVFLYQQGKAVSAAVKTGIRTPEEIQVTSGVAAGDTVITSGILQLRQAMPVEISELK